MNKFLLLSIPLLFSCNDTTVEADDGVESAIEEQPEMITMRIDFGEQANDGWFVMNDDVMGGVSIGDTYITETSIVFEGEVSTNNNGGFVSMRSPNGEYDLADYTMLEISYRSEGHDFTMIMADEMLWYMPEFKLDLIPQSSDWTTVTTPLSDFKQYAMTGYGETETGVEMSSQALSEIVRLELRNSVFASGDFRLEIDYIEFQAYLED